MSIGRVHVGLVVLGVPAGVPEVDLRDVRASRRGRSRPRRCSSRQKSSICLRMKPPLGCHRIRPGAGLVGDREEVELAAQLAVVAPLGLFEPVQVLVQLFLGEEGVPVDALHRRVALLALPVATARAPVSLKALIFPVEGRCGPEAEVDELAHRVALDDVAGLLLDQLALQRLALLREQLQRLGLGDQLLLDGPVLLDDVRHPLLDGHEVLGRERLAHEEVVEEAVVGGRTDAALRLGIQLGHRRGQQVGGRVAIDLDRGIGRLGLAGRTCVVEWLDGGATTSRRSTSGPISPRSGAPREPGRRGWN